MNWLQKQTLKSQLKKLRKQREKIEKELKEKNKETKQKTIEYLEKLIEYMDITKETETGEEPITKTDLEQLNEEELIELLQSTIELLEKEL